ncbi:MAG: SMC family ATPase, partial [Anaerolinea sp.]|nr:SMC family ATPase [Anaerolinea sp.]
EGSIKATQAKINRIINLDYETFVNSAFLQQGKADAFTVKQPSQRKQILSDILNLNRFESYEDAAKGEIKRLDDDINGINALIRGITEDLKREPQLRAVLAEAEAAQADAETKLAESEARLQQVAFAPSALTGAQTQAAAIETRLKGIDADLDVVEGEIKRQVAKIEQYEAISAQREQIEQGYLELQTARAAGDELADKLRQWSEIETRRHGLERQIDAERTTLKQTISGLEADVKNLDRTINAAKTDDLARLQAEIAELHALDQQREDLEITIAQLTQESAERTTIRDILYKEAHDIKAQQNRLASIEGATCPFCGQPLDAHTRDQMIADLEGVGKEKGDSYREAKARLEEIAATLTGKKDTFATLKTRTRGLAALEKQAGALSAGVEAAQKAEILRAEKWAQLEAAQAELSAEAFAHGLRSQLAALIADRDALGYDSGAHNEIQARLQTFSGYEARQTELEIALAALPDLHTDLENATARRERLHATRTEETAALDALRLQIVELQGLVKEYQTREQEVRQFRMAAIKAAEKVGSARQDLLALDDLRARKAELEARLAARRDERALYDELKLAFGKNGIPAMIIETAIPELEATANRLLARMTDGRMSLSMNTQREKKDGGMAETLEIQIADELGTRPYEMFSGGEAFRINFAIRIALSQMLARRAGAHLRTLFIDEGFGTQDDEGRNKLVEAIIAVQDEFAIILVVTHIEELRDQFPVHIAVEKTGDGSRVSIR